MRSRHMLVVGFLGALAPGAPLWAVDDGGEPPPPEPPPSAEVREERDNGRYARAVLAPVAVAGPLEAARSHIAAGNYAEALRSLKVAAETTPGDADIWNLAGYASRKLGRFGKAGEYYAHALRLDPAHLGALEYQGELFLQTGQMQKARANLARLKRLCANCEEMRELEKAIAAAS